MNRRNFLRGLLAGVSALAVPSLAKSEPVPRISGFKPDLLVKGGEIVVVPSVDIYPSNYGTYYFKSGGSRTSSEITEWLTDGAYKQ